MSDEREVVKGALCRLGRLAVPVHGADRESRRRHRIADAVDHHVRALSEESRKATRHRWTWLLAAAASVLVVGVTWLGLRFNRGEPKTSGQPIATLRAQGPVAVVRAGQSSDMDGRDAVPLVANDELVTHEAGASVLLASGAVVEVRPLATVRFEAAVARPDSVGEDLRLSQGTVSLSVPKLGAHRTLNVLTPDAIVTVRGTRFQVSVQGDAGHATTTVSVTEGSVWVTSNGTEIVLRPGATWSSDRSSALPILPAPSAATAAGSEEPNPSATPGNSAATVPLREDATSTLRAENEQYHRAVSAARGGDDARAVAELTTFMTKFPRSPLAQDARVERFRALSRLGRTDEATRAAKQYLVAFPAGFARDEATALALRSSQGAPGQP